MTNRDWLTKVLCRADGAIGIFEDRFFTVTASDFYLAKEEAMREAHKLGLEVLRVSSCAPITYVVATDSFMSGWGQATGTSYFAAACTTSDELDAALAKFRDRSEFKRIRTNLQLPRVSPGDNMKVVNPRDNPVWFEV